MPTFLIILRNLDNGDDDGEVFEHANRTGLTYWTNRNGIPKMSIRRQQQRNNWELLIDSGLKNDTNPVAASGPAILPNLAQYWSNAITVHEYTGMPISCFLYYNDRVSTKFKQQMLVYHGALH